MIEVKNLCFSYKNVEILKDVSFKCDKFGVYAVLGANGTGKSTLFKCCMNFIKPTKGDVCIDGVSSLKKSPSWMSKHIAYIPQQNAPTFSFSVFEVVLMGRNGFAGGLFHSKKDKQMAIHTLQNIGIAHLKDKIVANLSGGERQLVFLARALLQGCDTMILDEPTSALDFKNQMLFWDIVRKIAHNKTILVCTHEPNHAFWFCDDVIAIRDGEIKFTCRANELDEKKVFEIYNKRCDVFKEHGFIKPILKDAV